ncbi:MAG: hypothetical protein K6T31_10590 [Alicyclobacillus sp.]|nr:hypothetical protein [Alicyclobacillus sp.]
MLKQMTAVLGVCALILAGCATQSQTPAPPANSPAAQPTAAHHPTSQDYPVHTLTLIVPYAPGGGIDTAARILAPYLSQYLPNHPSVIVKNITGSDGVIGDEELLHSPPDGYTLAIFAFPGIVLPPLLHQAQYQLDQVPWLGQVYNQPYVAAVSTKSNIQSFQDLKNRKQVLVGATGLSTSAGASAWIAMKAFGIPAKIVPSAGSSQSVLAAAQGAVDYVQFPYNSIEQEIHGGLLKPLFVYSNKRLPELPNVPTIYELGYPELAGLATSEIAIGTSPVND